MKKDIFKGEEYTEEDKIQIGYDYLNDRHEHLFKPVQFIKDEKYLKQLQEISKNTEYKSVKRALNPTGSFKDQPSPEEWKKEYPELYEYLKSVTYPYNDEITYMWIKWYGVGHMSIMHRDLELEWWSPEPERDGLWYINNILIENNDFEGAKFVYGDDMMADWTVKKHRLEVFDMDIPGWGGTHHEYTLHGVSPLTKGSRTTLMVAKKTYESRKPFGWEPGKESFDKYFYWDYETNQHEWRDEFKPESKEESE